MVRLEKIKDKFTAFNIDALLVTSSYNLRYVSNFTGTAGVALITREKAYFITDFRYTDQATEQAKGFEVIEHKKGINTEVEKIIQRDSLKRVGFEENHVSYAEYQKMNDAFSAQLSPISNLVEAVRAVKEPVEIDTIQEAVNIAEAGFEHILSYIKVGMTEIQIANELDFFMREKGASGISFDTIVASGYRSAMPHGRASEKKVEEGDLITIDFGCYYKGYASDMTRTFALGQPDDELVKIHQIVLDAHLKVTEEAKPGMTGAEVDQIARDYITEKGYGDYFGHSTGHGLGLEVHEEPGINYRNDQPLVEGNIITNEPGIYLSGLGGVRIEDDLIVTADGVKTMNRTPRELIII